MQTSFVRAIRLVLVFLLASHGLLSAGQTISGGDGLSIVEPAVTYPIDLTVQLPAGPSALRLYLGVVWNTTTDAPNSRPFMRVVSASFPNTDDPTIALVQEVDRERIDLVAEEAGVYHLALQVEMNCTYDFLAQGVQSNFFQSHFELIVGGVEVGEHSTPASDFTFKGPILNVLEPQGEDLYVAVEPGQALATRPFALRKFQGSLPPPQQRLFFVDEHTTAHDYTVTDLRFTLNGTVHTIPRDATSSTPERDVFVIEPTGPTGSAALYAKLMEPGEITVLAEEVIDVEDLCFGFNEEDKAYGTLHFGWTPDGVFTEALCKPATAPCRLYAGTGPKITGEMALDLAEGCYYDGSALSKVTVTFINKGGTDAHVLWYDIAPGSLYLAGPNSADIVVDGENGHLFPLTITDALGNSTAHGSLASIPGVTPIVAPTDLCSSNDASACDGFRVENEVAGWFPIIPKNDTIFLTYYIRICAPTLKSDMTCEMGPDNRRGFNVYDHVLKFDYACHELEGLTYAQITDPHHVVRPSITAHRGAVTQTTYALNDKNRYIYNCISPCFIDGEQPEDLDPNVLVDKEHPYDIAFRFNDQIALWPTTDPTQERMGILLEFQPALFLYPPDLTGHDENGDPVLDDAGNPVIHPVYLVFANGTRWSTEGEDPEIELAEMCQPLDCPDGNGYQGWTLNQKVLLLFRSIDTLNSTGGIYERVKDKLQNAVLHVPLRMHCNGDAGNTQCRADGIYVGCPYASTKPAPATANVRVNLVHYPNGACEPSLCGSPFIPLSCISRRYAIQCPGCGRHGIHADWYNMTRANYGLQDNDDNGIPDLPLTRITPENVADHPGVQTNLVTYGDTLWGDLGTSIHIQCPDYKPCDGAGEPAVDLDHLYYEIKNYDDYVGAQSYCPSPLDPAPGDCGTCTEGVLKVIGMEMIMIEGPTNARVETFHIRIDDPGVMDGIKEWAPSGDYTYRFNLSPSKLQPLFSDPHVTVVTNTADYGSTDFKFNDLEQAFIHIRIKYKVVCNIWPDLSHIEVRNNVYLTTREGASGTFRSDNGPEEMPSLDCDNAPPGFACDSLRWFCTMKLGGFTLAGYNLTATDAADQRACGNAVGRHFRLDIGYGSSGAPANLFRNEYRNFFRLTELSDRMFGTEVDDWSNARMTAVETRVHGVPANREITFLAEHIPEQGGAYHLLSVAEEDLYMDVPMTEQSLDASRMLLPDDDFQILVLFQRDANMGTPSGPLRTVPIPPLPPIPPTDYYYAHQPHYSYERAFPINSSDLRSVPCPDGVGGDACKAGIYNRQVITVENVPVMDDANEGKGPIHCWERTVFIGTEGSSWPSAVDGLWVAVDENGPGDVDMDVVSIDRWNLGAWESLIPPGQSGIDNLRKYLLLGTADRYSDPRIRVCAHYACSITPMQDPNGATDGNTVGDDEAQLYIGWGCEGVPSATCCADAATCEDCFLSNDPQEAEYVSTATLFVRPAPRELVPLQPTLVAEDGPCTITVDVPMESRQRGNVWDILVAFENEGAWTYVPGSAEILIAGPGGALTSIGHEGDAFKPFVDMPGSSGCTAAGSWIGWTLNDELYRSEYPGTHHDVLVNGLGGASAELVPQLHVRATFRAATCGSFEDPFDVWVSSEACGFLPQCKYVTLVDETLPVPAASISDQSDDLRLACEATDAVSFTITNGLAETTDGQLVLDVTLPAGLELVEPWTPACVTEDWSIDGTTHTLTLPLSGLAAGAGCTIEFSVRAIAPCTPGESTIHAALSGTNDCGLCGTELATSSIEVVRTTTECALTDSILTEPSLCGGPGNATCGAFEIGSSYRPVHFNGTDYKFRYSGASYTGYGSTGIWTMTGELINVNDDATDRYWLQLYVSDAQDHATWTGGSGHLVDPFICCGTTDATTWSFLGIDDGFESLLVGLGNNHEVYDLSAASGYRFQRGAGAGLHTPADGASLRFTASPRGGGAAVTSNLLQVALNCNQTGEKYSACTGTITVADVAGAEEGPVTVSLVGIETQDWTGIPLTFTELCNGTYILHIEAGDCSRTDTIVLHNDIEVLSAEVDFTPVVCAEDHGCATFTATGGVAPYTGHWFWTGVVDGTEPITGPGTPYCGLATGEESWVVVEDANGCFVTYKMLVALDEDMANAPFDHSVTNSCVNTGAIALEMVPGDYTFAWTGPGGYTSTSEDITGLAPGTYIVTVDAADHRCAWTDTIAVGNACSGPAIQNCSSLTGLTLTSSISAATVSGAVDYWYHFTNDCGYSRQINSGSSNPARSLNWSVLKLELCMQYDLRARAQLSGGTYTDWGPPCTITLSGCDTGAVKLKAPYCGGTNLSLSSTVTATKKLNVCRYRFEFSNSTLNYTRFLSTYPQGHASYSYSSNVCPLGFITSPLQPCTQYKVRVATSMSNDLVNPNWSAYGPYCTITTAGCGSGQTPTPAFAAVMREFAPRLTVYPNPNDGATVRVRLDDLPPEFSIVEIRMFDVLGRGVHQDLGVTQGGMFATELDLGGRLANGVYSIQVRVGTGEWTERLVIQR